MRLLSVMCEKVPIVVILGATGAGKSQLALELAQKYGGEIINADAMQMYKGLDIVTNKVTEEEMRAVKHHMIGMLDPRSTSNVVDFKNKALPIVERLMREGKIPFICGGTNYYIESLLWKVLMDEDTPLLIANKRSQSESPTDSTKKRAKIEASIPEGAEKHEEVPMPRIQPDAHLANKTTTELDLDSWNSEEDDDTIPTSLLYSKLKEVDPDRAGRLHPNERRKIWRSLQVFQQHGISHSKLISSQGGHLGGGLRFPAQRICIIEVWSEMEILENRCNRRVDKMIERGMLQELREFHIDFNKDRLDKGKEPDYTHGIFQSIGFKEFHNFLLLSDEEKKTPEGQKEFEKGVKQLKIATRQYAKRQLKWMRSRFLNESRESPLVYRVDSSQPEKWRENCHEPACAILESFIHNTAPPSSHPPLSRFKPANVVTEGDQRTFHCDVCERDFQGSQQWEEHIRGKRHKRTLRDNKMSERQFVLTLVEADVATSQSKLESSRILKNSLELGLTEVGELLERMPCEVASYTSLAKAENIAKCLAKKNILVKVKEITVPRDGITNVKI